MTEALVIERAGSVIEISLAHGHWMIRRIYNQPITFTRYSSFTGEPIQETRSEEAPIACDNHQLLNLVTEDECRLLLGYCTHLLEQGITHLEYLHTAVGEALARKDWDVVTKLLEEFHDEVHTHELIRSLAVDVLTSEDAKA